MSTDRRTFLKVLGVGAAGLVGAKQAAASGGEVGSYVKDTDACMLYDTTLCVGCKACVSACKRTNAGPTDGVYSGQGVQQYVAPFDQDAVWDAPPHLDPTTRTVIELYKSGEPITKAAPGRRNTDKSWSYVKKQCMHCGKPGCVSACPVSAMKKDAETGIVYWTNICCGCRYCMISCPFDVPKFELDQPFPLLVKCDMCFSTVNKEGKGQPACTKVCPNEAVIYGKRGELLEIARKRQADRPETYIPHIYGEQEIGGTNYLVLTHVDAFQKLGFPKLSSKNYSAMCEKIQHTVYKGFIAPPVLFATLAFIAWRNGKKHEKHD